MEAVLGLLRVVVFPRARGGDRVAAFVVSRGEGLGLDNCRAWRGRRRRRRGGSGRGLRGGFGGGLVLALVRRKWDRLGRVGGGRSGGGSGAREGRTGAPELGLLGPDKVVGLLFEEAKVVGGEPELGGEELDFAAEFCNLARVLAEGRWGTVGRPGAMPRGSAGCSSDLRASDQHRPPPPPPPPADGPVRVQLVKTDDVERRSGWTT